MALIIKSFFSFYNHLYVTLKDNRSENYYFINDSPLPLFTVIAAYLLISRYGPCYMRSRKAYDLKSVIAVYNLIQVTGNACLCLSAVYVMFGTHRSNMLCPPLDYGNSKQAIAEMNLAYFYFLTKLLDLFDTVFMVLKKKNSQISFLHVYHHWGMLLLSYIAAKWLPGGPPAMLGIINTFVHVVMYFYYFLTAFKPEMKTSFWFKKHITQLQLAQFTILFFHFAYSLLDKKCLQIYPQAPLWCLLIQAVCLMALFGDFYYKTYIRKRK